MDPAIENFLSERKDKRLKSKIKATTSESEKISIKQEAEKEFFLENFLPNAAQRASQLSLVSHVSKFTHPGAKSSTINFIGKQEADGFLYSGNVQQVEADILGNAASIDVFKFLSLQLEDGKTILEHLEQETEKIRNEFCISTASFDELREGFLAVKRSDEKQFTDTKLKQVYFPISPNEYHLLSLLTPSGITFKLKDKIQGMRDRAHEIKKKIKEARGKKEVIHNSNGYTEIYNLTMIGYGGNKPQNISILNSNNGGKTYLLPSLPPLLDKRYLRLPRKDFFNECLWYKNFEENFRHLHKQVLSNKRNNKWIRDRRDRLLQNIISNVINRMWVMRSFKNGWTLNERCQLDPHQKIWLDDARMEERQKNDDWLKSVIDDFAHWIMSAYKNIMKDESKLLDDEDLKCVRKLVTATIEDDMEGFR